MKQIGVLIERQRIYGRRLCEGIVRFTQTQKDWSLNMLVWDDLDNPHLLRRYNGFIARVIDDDMARKLRLTKKPVVDVYVSKPREGFASADQNARLVGQMAARHFIEHKFSRFAFFGHEGNRYSDIRRNAFARCLALNHYPCDIYKAPPSFNKTFDENVIRRELYQVGSEGKYIRKWLSRLEKPIAIFCSNDLRAYQLCAICREEGIRVPKDVAILGVDNDFLLCNFIEPTLSSIDPNAEEIGFASAKVLAEMLKGDSARNVRVPPRKLIERGSSMTYPIHPHWLSDALVFIRGNITRKLSASDVFAHLGKSHTLVNAAFRNVLNTTVTKEIAKARTSEAIRLLKSTDLSIADVSRQSGFASVQYFTNAFTTATGKSPAAYRARERPPHKMEE